ncbi:TetR/AcrR family transcriptional regulator [Desulfosporosinus fructosivorans]|uniref:TetR/AcrR family transcriptional regulator n=1 Tax=Desulfosporosinus fructosivorans TaxID=2018669 RepID=A0A4Z0R0Z0_9FIRM|nr:TetR/AcrR family transcriptional regulator [Desulfosporosinus fructosivorans]TGE35647.1 TetR/AcrR family transcriptional regulator [Desulfosporosinus fructosivorans]
MPKKTFFRLDEEKQERVVRAAISEFHTNGFAKAKVETIAENAAVAKGSIYQYFENKKELFMHSVTWSMEYFMREIDKYTPLQEMDVFDYLLKDGRKRVELLNQETTLMLFFQDIMSGKFGSLTKTINDELWKIGDKYILQLIAVGKQKGTIRTDLDDSILALYYKGVTSQFDDYVFRIITENNFELSDSVYQEIEATINQVIELLKNGMGR